jgi:hypothetical protein
MDHFDDTETGARLPGQPLFLFFCFDFFDFFVGIFENYPKFLKVTLRAISI